LFEGGRSDASQHDRRLHLMGRQLSLKSIAGRLLGQD
jgi:hypothetical protein